MKNKEDDHRRGDSTASTFLELARERFEARNGRPATFEESNFSLDRLQGLLRMLMLVPKAGSSEASVVARRLGGCVPRGPCCMMPGHPPGSCPSEGLMCPAVLGCTAHKMDPKRNTMLEDPSVFSMSNIRDVVDRMVSGFLYTQPHSPLCTRTDDVDYESCFEEMMNTTKFQNVAARMVSGHDAYDSSIKLCMNKDQDVGGEAACAEDLESVMKGACNLNFVTMCEAWGSSVLLLFETLPWLEPTADFFPAPRHRHHQCGCDLGRVTPVYSSEDAKESAASGPQRQNTGAKHEEGMKHITPELRDAARSANAVDEALHELVSAKFCERLREAGLLHHPLVVAELATYEPLEHRYAIGFVLCQAFGWGEADLRVWPCMIRCSRSETPSFFALPLSVSVPRCNDETWAKDTLERFAPIMPDECRLYQPFEKQ
ncbi:unnamed protein product [Ectocarpus sp. CCAP 1310/34]|nr:unnamed protein product [Ectocarpus sp. CCAP 1310/34]